ncbi:hypothetical protein Plhal304r1_c101g0174981 [Plasmopara halstedii]
MYCLIIGMHLIKRCELSHIRVSHASMQKLPLSVSPEIHHEHAYSSPSFS